MNASHEDFMQAKIPLNQRRQPAFAGNRGPALLCACNSFAGMQRLPWFDHGNVG
jgi:hypothetical protein